MSLKQAAPGHGNFFGGAPTHIREHAKPPFIVRSTPVLDSLDDDRHFGDFRDDLKRDGYAVVKALDKEKAQKYVDEIHDWLESFGLGYDRNDPSTISEKHLPIIHPTGMIQAYGAPHESFTWAVRSEPAVIDVFAKLYGTDDLICSYDSINVSLPNRRDIPENTPWAHQDQDPERPGFRCVQGFVNLVENGDNDGGLMVLVGGHKISEEYHKEFFNEERSFRWTNETYGFKDTGLAWLKERGYEWIKVNAGPGDLVLWDSRTPHYNRSPKGDNARFVIYTCMMPISTCTQEELIRKRDLFNNLKGTSHWPQGLQPHVEDYVQPWRNGEKDPYNKWAPRKPPQLSPRAYKLTGIPYIQASA